MDGIAFYRKYRPQTLDQLIGQDQVKQQLLQAFQNNKLSHAYLLVGPRGTGKTSTARILAKMINCVGHESSVKGQVPCNKCASCLSITDGSNLDLIEIDAASNRGIDDIRSLRETVKLAPASSKRKVYIIDEVHMLTTEAFNALLKTLEEPPGHVLFILATTELGKVPQTILSRVTRLDFKLAGIEDVLKSLKKILDGEEIKISEEALRALAKKADGSFRDGVKLLDQISSSGKEVDLKDIEENLRGGNFDDLVAILNKLTEKNGQEALILVVKQEELGVQVKDLTLNLLEFLRYLVFIKSGLGSKLVQEEVGSDKYQVLVGLADKFSGVGQIANIVDKLQEALEKVKSSSIPFLPLEIAVVEICQVSPSVILNEEKRSEESINSAASRRDPSSPSPADSSDLSKIQEKWSFVLETIRPYNYSLEALLRNTKIAEVSESAVILEVPYTFHQRILEAPKSRELLESVLSEVLGKSIRVSTILGVRPQRVEDIANIEMAAEDEIITLASDIFNGKLVD